MPGTLIIAIGNPLRGDDGVAWHVAAALEERPLPPQTGVRTVHQLLPELAEETSRAQHVIFIDASLSHLAGEVAISGLTEDRAIAPKGTHELDPAGVLALARRLFGEAPPATLVLVGGASFDHSDVLSPQAALAVPTAVSRVLALLESTPTAAP